MKIGVIFAGQGQQFKNMGVDLCLYDQNIKKKFDKASAILEYDIFKILEDEHLLNQTICTQPTLVTLSSAIYEYLCNLNLKVDVVAGLSLGEYNALEASNVISFEDMLAIIKQRASIMANSFEIDSTFMMAVLKADINAIEKLLEDERLNNEVGVCNYNTYDQIVIGGSKDKFDLVRTILKENGFNKMIPLNVSMVSHMSLLNDAALKLEKVLNNYTFLKPKIKFINNIKATYQEKDFVSTLSKQISNPTRMAQTIELMLNDGVDTFIEIGPKETISKFVKSISKSLNKEVKIYNVYNVVTLKNVVKELGLVNE